MSETPATRKAAIWVVIVFLLGAAAGVMLGYGYAHHSVAAANRPLPEAERRAQRVAQLTQELSLTSDQARQLDAILLQRHMEAKAIHEQSEAQLDKNRQKGRDQVRAILTPVQKPKFEAFLQRQDADRKRNAPQTSH
jgi:Spy/CpxP family protein refolding chaperone